MAVSDGSQTTKDALASEPSGKTKVSPQDAIEQMIAERVHRALSDAGRDAASMEKQKTEASQLLAEARKERQGVERLRQEQEAGEIEKYADNPDMQEIIKSRQRARIRQEELDRRAEDLASRESAINAERAEYQGYKIKTSAATIAAKYPGANADDLLTLTDGTPEKMEALAKKLATTAKGTLKVNSGLSSGGSNLTIKELRRQYLENPLDADVATALAKAERDDKLRGLFS